LFEVRVRQSFVGFTHQANPLVLTIFFQDFLMTEEEFVSLKRRYSLQGCVNSQKKTFKMKVAFGKEIKWLNF
tara:strand:- start:102 stop:317 length:216 start_codon:yes stop_codon:yes gene_type:complete